MECGSLFLLGEICLAESGELLAPPHKVAPVTSVSSAKSPSVPFSDAAKCDTGVRDWSLSDVTSRDLSAPT